VIAWAESIYDQVLIDAPPILAVTDAAIAGRLLDGAVLVIRPDKNRRKMVIRAVQSYVSTGVNVVGLIVNHLAPDTPGGYGYGYGYGYGHDDPAEEDEQRLAA